MKNLNLNLTLLVIVLVLLIGCELQLNTGNRSGTIDDDYIAEPIGKYSIKYTNALKTSNTVINHLIENEYETIYNDFIHDEMKHILTIESLKNINTQIITAVGPFKNYKKMQWGFVPANENGRDLLFSIKIIEHEKNSLNYSFVFNNDGKYEKLVGLQIKERKGARPPNKLN